MDETMPMFDCERRDKCYCPELGECNYKCLAYKKKEIKTRDTNGTIN